MSVVSIREVAARAGVSRATVSKRVRRAAQELGYHPSAVARGLARKRMDTLGVVLTPGQSSPIDSPFFGVLFNGILKAAAARHQNVTLVVGETWESADKSLPRFRDGRCDGLLIFYQPEGSDLIPALLGAGVPTVLVNDRRDDPRASWVDVENFASSRTATEHLLSLGHTRLAFLAEYSALTFVPARQEGFFAAIEAAGLPRSAGRVVYTGFHGDEIGRSVDALMDCPAAQRPTALFCVADGVAAQAIAALARRGLRVPHDVSVVGFNDDAAATRVHPELTTMRQPYDRIGAEAVSLLLEQIADPTRRGRHAVLPTELIVRGSTGPAPQD
jgi:LacI family transcriptional regulator